LGSFYLANVEIYWTFSFASAILSIIPIIGAYVIWIPVSLFVFARDGPFMFCIFVGINLLGFLADTMIYNNLFANQNPNLLSVALILGLYAFGWSGLFKGPLIVGITSALLTVYTTKPSAAGHQHHHHEHRSNHQKH